MKEEEFLKEPKCPYCLKPMNLMEKKEKRMTHYIKQYNPKFDDITYVDTTYNFYCEKCRIYIHIGNESMERIK